MTTKQALNNAMMFAAGRTNRIRALSELAREVSEDVFMKCVKQHPSTMERDVKWAHEDFLRAKEEYESHCKEIGSSAYCTWDND